MLSALSEPLALAPPAGRPRLAAASVPADENGLRLDAAAAGFSAVPAASVYSALVAGDSVATSTVKPAVKPLDLPDFRASLGIDADDIMYSRADGTPSAYASAASEAALARAGRADASDAECTPWTDPTARFRRLEHTNFEPMLPLPADCTHCRPRGRRLAQLDPDARAHAYQMVRELESHINGHSVSGPVSDGCETCVTDRGADRRFRFVDSPSFTPASSAAVARPFSAPDNDYVLAHSSPISTFARRPRTDENARGGLRTRSSLSPLRYTPKNPPRLPSALDVSTPASAESSMGGSLVRYGPRPVMQAVDQNLPRLEDFLGLASSAGSTPASLAKASARALAGSPPKPQPIKRAKLEHREYYRQNYKNQAGAAGPPPALWTHDPDRKRMLLERPDSRERRAARRSEVLEPRRPRPRPRECRSALPLAGDSIDDRDINRVVRELLAYPNAPDVSDTSANPVDFLAAHTRNMQAGLDDSLRPDAEHVDVDADLVRCMTDPDDRSPSAGAGQPKRKSRLRFLHLSLKTDLPSAPHSVVSSPLNPGATVLDSPDTDSSERLPARRRRLRRLIGLDRLLRPRDAEQIAI
ncbi:uncharacterized protein V1510DRAFT_408623 [Dipodascopsis tothii]|uniref:uncharacterized protein n=1 Tax=Dipodascopsis tothii TaxID=44089 RepID=UPI0034CEB5F1